VVGGYALAVVVTRPEDLVTAGSAGLLAVIAFYPIPIAMSLIMLLTPTGSLPSPRWRWLAVTSLVAPVVGAVANVFGSHPLADPPTPPVSSPLAVPALAGPLELVSIVARVTIALAALAAAGSLVVRFRRARGIERQQLRWVVFAVTTVVPVAILLGIVLDNPASAWAGGAGVLAVQLAIYADIVRYRLYDLDRIISRTLAYALLTLLLGGGYAAVVLGLGQLLPRDSSLVVAGATLAVAAAFQPARRRVQDLVDRRFNRRRYDAAGTVEAFAARLRDQIDLNALHGELLAVVDQTMQPTQASLWLRPPATPRPQPGPLATAGAAVAQPGARR
jgi:hypothetical protein